MKAEGGGKIATLPNAVGVEGGLPIFQRRKSIVGSIGISGVTICLRWNYCSGWFGEILVR